MARARFVETLRLLAAADVEFIVVGMTAGVLQGAPVTTLDLDVLHRRTPENVARLLKALRELRAVYRGDPRRLSPTESHLAGPGHQLLETVNGDLDCLGSIGDGQSYEELLGSTVDIVLSGGLHIRVLDLPTLIELKTRAGRPKDLAAIPHLEATLKEQQKIR
jgi:hypothetical protein